jgi:hypothetical protein
MLYVFKVQIRYINALKNPFRLKIVVLILGLLKRELRNFPPNISKMEAIK